ncbi:hypothetical protein QR680_010892 [Steinernema hermaphroditum]|uniref:Uncharacterized protein n=1 Tax=Steinernema hermaphroditum TaxID=289476 RepID=A0AA39IS78_9BILA|nr:hypothetical protein QR680_010892 [Steinernema hermaphroditum]
MPPDPVHDDPVPRRCSGLVKLVEGKKNLLFSYVVVSTNPPKIRRSSGLQEDEFKCTLPFVAEAAIYYKLEGMGHRNDGSLGYKGTPTEALHKSFIIVLQS